MIFLEKLKKGEMFETAGLKGVKIIEKAQGTFVAGCKGGDCD